MTVWNYTLISVLLLYLLMVVATVITVIQERRDPVKALSWIALVALLPVAGLIIFLFFGQDYRKRKIFNRKEIKDLRQIDELSDKQVRQLGEIEIEEVVKHGNIIKLLLNNSKTLLTLGNKITILNNGKETFDSIIDEIEKAESSIHLEYYIIEDDELGNRIADILVRKAQAGVEVRLIYDDVGSWGLPRKFIRRLRDAGVKTYCFMPVVFPWFSSKINYRNHRKILVVDGKVGFTGGLNIADRYIRGTKHGIWRDTHLRLEGEAVHMLQIAFLTDWYFSSKEPVRNRKKYLPPVESTDGPAAIQIALSGPDSDWATIMQAYFSAITGAQKHIYISTPYFLPNESILCALKVAALSGVDVRIMLPERSDSKMVHWASRSYFAELLEAKIKIYLYIKGFNHSKLIMIDGTFGSVGTANMDVRSFEDNFEITAMIYDRKYTGELEEQFMRDLAGCRRITMRKWLSRKHKDNFIESVARLFSPML